MGSGQRGELEESTSTETLAGGYLIEAVYGLILVVTVLTWSVVGFAVWVPLLVRSTSLLAGAVFYSSLFRDQARVTNAQRSVHFAVRFYIRGFAHFLSFYQQRHDPEPPIGLFEPISDMKWKELLVECAWVVGVWTVGYFAIHALFLASARRRHHRLPPSYRSRPFLVPRTRPFYLMVPLVRRAPTASTHCEPQLRRSYSMPVSISLRYKCSRASPADNDTNIR
jgi:hypothetical protein